MKRLNIGESYIIKGGIFHRRGLRDMGEVEAKSGKVARYELSCDRHPASRGEKIEKLLYTILQKSMYMEIFIYQKKISLFNITQKFVKYRRGLVNRCRREGE